MNRDADIDAVVAHYRDTYAVRALRPPTRFSRSLAFWAPRDFVGTDGIDVDGFLEDLDDAVRARGMVLHDRQVTSTLLEAATTVESIFERDASTFVPPPSAESPVVRLPLTVD